MIKISPESKIFVYCPGNFTTGGAELLHQLVHYLNNLDIESFIVYFDYKNNDLNKTSGFKCPKEYEKYHINIGTTIEEKESNVVVFYEGIFQQAFNIGKCQIILWWLSVDHFFLSSSKYLSIYDYFKWNKILGLKLLLKRIIKKSHRRKNSKLSIKNLVSLDALNCYQSEYAHHFLMENNFNNILPLSDYINEELTANKIRYISDNRNDTILYNPKKGFKFTEKLIQLAPDLDWFPLIGMSRSELMTKMQESKIYIDFGYHPGKDRLPREAAINGCCIITNTRGSASFFEDVRIADEFKIEDNTPKQDVINLINDILQNYDSQITKFSFYRHSIKSEKRIFESQIDVIFNNKERE